MPIASILNIAMASINFYVGGYYLYFYSKRPQIKEHLPFALVCLCVGFYNVFCAGLYNSTSVPDGIFWQRLQLQSMASIAVSLIWFSRTFIAQKPNRVVRFLIFGFVGIFLASLVVNPVYTLSADRPAVKDFLLFHSLRVTYYEAEIGPVFLLEFVLAVIAFTYFVSLFYRHYRQTKNKASLLILICQCTYFLGVINDTLVSTQVYRSIYVSEYTFFLIVIAMAYVLLDRFVALYRAYEGLNVRLEEKVSERTREIEQLNESLKHIADHDDLTGVYNRRFFNEYFEFELKRVKNYLEYKARMLSTQENEMNFGLAIIDIDHFKEINDTYGHLVGDSVLKQIIAIIQENIFTRDVLCRYGGDEFALLLTKTSNEGILQALEKIKKEVEEHAFVIDSEHPGRQITISAGLVNFSEVRERDGLEALKLADDRLLRAKTSGRNRIIYDDLEG